MFEDDHVYIVSGNRNVRLQELKKDLGGPKEGGLDRILVSDSRNPGLGFEGSHFYKINGMYYLFLIHSLPDRWMRTQACYVSDSLTGELEAEMCCVIPWGIAARALRREELWIRRIINGTPYFSRTEVLSAESRFLCQ